MPRQFNDKLVSRTRSQIEEEAERVLQRHNIVHPPIDPIRIANANRIPIYNARFTDDSISGMLAERGTSIVMLINQVDSAFRKRFTIAHELGHHILHLPLKKEHITRVVDLFRAPSESNSRENAEIQANQFAAALLMPRQMVSDLHETGMKIKELSRVFQVSEEAMGYRFNTLGLV